VRLRWALRTTMRGSRFVALERLLVRLVQVICVYAVVIMPLTLHPRMKDTVEMASALGARRLFPHAGHTAHCLRATRSCAHTSATTPWRPVQGADAP